MGTSPRRFDVAIVGAGPAGARAAWRLARSGARVAILDGSHPREKPCGGGVTGRALDIVRDAIAPETLPSVAIADATFEHRGDRVAMRVGKRSHAGPLLAVMSRRDFDGALLAAAIDAGAHVIPARARKINREPGGWILDAGAERVIADWVLGADGANSFVRRTVGTPFARADLSIATGFYAHGRTSSTIAIAFEDEPPGYLWSFPRPDHLAVGACAQADQASSAALLSIVTAWLASNVAPGADLERYSWPIPSLTLRALDREHPSGPGWLLLGDAGGMVDPITREGIYFALASGDAAADSLALGHRAARGYEQRVQDTVYAELRRAAKLKARFFNSHFTALLIEALQASAGIRGVMTDLIAGAQPYRGLRRRLLRTGELRLGLRLLGGKVAQAVTSTQ
jgi:geranylgeranyl reductase family protein